MRRGTNPGDDHLSGDDDEDYDEDYDESDDDDDGEDVDEDHIEIYGTWDDASTLSDVLTAIADVVAHAFQLHLHYADLLAPTGRERFGTLHADHFHADSADSMMIVFDLGTMLGADAVGLTGAEITLAEASQSGDRSGTSLGRSAGGAAGSQPQRGVTHTLRWELPWPPPGVQDAAQVRMLLIRLQFDPLADLLAGPQAKWTSWTPSTTTESALDSEQLARALRVEWYPDPNAWAAHNPTGAVGSSQSQRRARNTSARRQPLQAVRDLLGLSDAVPAAEARFGDARLRPRRLLETYRVHVLVEMHGLDQVRVQVHQEAEVEADAAVEADASAQGAPPRGVQLRSDVAEPAAISSAGGYQRHNAEQVSEGMVAALATGIAYRALSQELAAGLPYIYRPSGIVQIWLTPYDEDEADSEAPDRLGAIAVAAGRGDLARQYFSALATHSEWDWPPRSATTLGPLYDDILYQNWFWPAEDACFSEPDASPVISRDTLLAAQHDPERFAVALFNLHVRRSAVTASPLQLAKVTALAVLALDVACMAFDVERPFPRAVFRVLLDQVPLDAQSEAWVDAAVLVCVERDWLASAENGERLAVPRDVASAVAGAQDGQDSLWDALEVFAPGLVASEDYRIATLWRQRGYAVGGDLLYPERPNVAGWSGLHEDLITTDRHIDRTLLAHLVAHGYEVVIQQALDADDTRTLRLLLPHLRHLWVSHHDWLPAHRIQIGRLLGHVAGILDDRHQALTWMREVLAWHETARGPDNAAHVADLALTAQLLLHFGRSEEAAPLVACAEEIIGRTHPIDASLRAEVRQLRSRIMEWQDMPPPPPTTPPTTLSQP